MVFKQKDTISSENFENIKYCTYIAAVKCVAMGRQGDVFIDQLIIRYCAQCAEALAHQQCTQYCIVGSSLATFEVIHRS